MFKNYLKIAFRDLVKNKVYSIVCFSVIGLISQECYGIDCQAVLKLIIKTSAEYSSSENTLAIDDITKTVNDLRKYNRTKINTPRSKDFEELQEKTERIQNQLNPLAVRFESENYQARTIITLCETYFNSLYKVQSLVSNAYRAFPWKDQTRNMLPNIQIKTSINHSKICLLSMVASFYQKAESQEDKKLYWETANNMLKKIKFNKTEHTSIGINAITLHTDIIKAIEMFKSTYDSELDEEIRTYASRIIEEISRKQQQLTIQLEETKKRKTLLSDQFKSSKEYNTPTEKEPANKMLRESKSTITAKDWFQKGYKAESDIEKIKYFTKAIDKDSTFSPALINRGSCNMNLQRYPKAIQDYSKTIALGSQNKLVYLCRGICFRRLEKHDKAVPDYNRVIEIDSTYADAYKQRGVSYTKLGELHKAIIDYKKAIKLSPTDANAYYVLGSAYWAQGKWHKGIKAWEKCLEIDPDHKNAREWLPEAKEAIKPKKRTIYIKN